ncbi:hypothetical protein Fot_32812 [Forsythia ovata]|uniref:Uncharacterized protein n=1 Tax=Forsythia ovata TaxID=205694 RepID=A0ABD1T999_9LAMI
MPEQRFAEYSKVKKATMKTPKQIVAEGESSNCEMGTKGESSGCEMESKGESGGCETENRCGTVGIEVTSQDESLGTPIERVEEGMEIQTEGAYVLQYNEHIYCNIKPEWEAFMDRHEDEICNSWEDGFGINNE